MRILYLHQYFNTPQMSGGTRSYEMARRLVAAGHEVNMITSDRSGVLGNKWRVTNEAGIVVHWMSIPYSNRMSYARRIWAFSQFAIQSAIRTATIPADVIFATSTPLTIALPAIYASRWQNIPMVFEVRDLWPELPIAMGAIRGRIPISLARRLEKFAYDNAAAIVALSPGMKAGVERQGYPENRITVIPNSSDLDLFQVPSMVGEIFRSRYQWLDSRPLVLYAGTFGRINDVGYLVNLASAMLSVDSNIRFLAVGDGYELENIRRQAQKLAVLDTNFFLLPSLPKSEVPGLFSAATIATSLFIDRPEMWSNSANKFFDALAAGRPIAINYEGWQADLLRDSRAGLVLPANEPYKGALLLANAIHDTEWRIEAGIAASNLARMRFDRDKLAQELEAVLLRAVAA